MIWKLQFLRLFMLFYLSHPALLHMNISERRNADITDIVYIYFWQFEHDIWVIAR